jgi:hypothetical protein
LHGAPLPASSSSQTVKQWERRDVNNYAAFQAMAAISIADLREIGRAQAIKVDDNFVMAISDVSLATDLSIEGLSAGIALLLKSKGF